ncbi:hypothetical protein JCM8547_007762 [Rhodosporidiobolus lusitaniae]
MAIQTLPDASSTSTYPAQISLQAALQPRETDDMTAVPIDFQTGARTEQKTAEQEEQDALRLKGGCFECGPVDCCCIPCTVM